MKTQSISETCEKECGYQESPQGKIMVRIQEIYELLYCLNDRFSKFREKLSPVINNIPYGDPCDKMCENRECESPLAEDLDNIKSKIMKTIDDIDTAHELCQL